ncbi:hypothetical protein T12_6661, partial [Trichinella patagoniensis]
LIWVCIEIQQQRLLPGFVLTPTNFQHLTNRLSQPRTKLYCSEISSKLFPDYYDRRTAKWTRSTVSFMCTVILTFPLILTCYWKIISVNQVHLFVGLTRECETCPKIMRRVIGGKQVQKLLRYYNAVRQTMAVRNQGASARSYIQVKI